MKRIHIILHIAVSVLLSSAVGHLVNNFRQKRIEQRIEQIQTATLSQVDSVLAGSMNALKLDSLLSARDAEVAKRHDSITLKLQFELRALNREVRNLKLHDNELQKVVDSLRATLPVLPEF